MFGKVGHFILQEAVLMESPPGMLIHLGHRLLSGRAYMSDLNLFEEPSASLKGQLIQRHVVVAHLQQLRQLIFPGSSCLLGSSEHNVHRHPARAQPPGLLDSL